MILPGSARLSPALRQQWGAGPHDMVVLCVGRLAAEKNLNVLVQAFQAMQATEARVKLVLVGDGPERSALQQRCPTAVFAGLRRGEDLAAHSASADLFLFPSLTETFGNVVPEAMASGLAVLAFDDAAAHQVVRHGDSGLLVPCGDNAALCAAAQRLVGQSAWVRTLGEQARVVACQMDWGRIVQQIERVYVTALSHHTFVTDPALRRALPQV